MNMYSENLHKLYTILISAQKHYTKECSLTNIKTKVCRIKKNAFSNFVFAISQLIYRNLKILVPT